jgi:DNA ligase-associated metallophosphoesterase
MSHPDPAPVPEGIHATLTPEVEVLLLPQRALFWSAEATLFVADLHLGKADAFHRHGIPVPGAVTFDDLDRLGDLVMSTGARRLVVLGDLMHARSSQSAAVLDAMAVWRALHPPASLEVMLINGNHDRRAGPPPAELAIELPGNEAHVGPFCCVHEPPGLLTPAPPVEHLTLCGHIHPMAILHDGPRGLRLPCFHQQGLVLTLPAFGRFTGGAPIRSRPGDRVWVIAGGAVLPVFGTHPAPN